MIKIFFDSSPTYPTILIVGHKKTPPLIPNDFNRWPDTNLKSQLTLNA
ncbi:hypothetical protein DES35_101374 [Schleiferia thermophila]|uniref:Uncharacterized protein n=1 Tax=Schleiferia thermophila TaxID=884107 RepID=A0A369ACE8_9FLAO|nr:hypothetical protein DES35_101374 [Schleiferia thermophila]